MTDRLTKVQRSRLMSRVRSTNTNIELLVYAHLRNRSIYFRKHYKRAPGTPDIARPIDKKAVFIHSDFWHGWQFPRWADKLSSDFWRTKISQNRERDRRKVRQLRSRGWRVLVVWEHSLKRYQKATFGKIRRFLVKGQSRRRTKPPR